MPDPSDGAHPSPAHEPSHSPSSSARSAAEELAARLEVPVGTVHTAALRILNPGYGLPADQPEPRVVGVASKQHDSLAARRCVGAPGRLYRRHS